MTDINRFFFAYLSLVAMAILNFFASANQKIVNFVEGFAVQFIYQTFLNQIGITER